MVLSEAIVALEAWRKRFPKLLTLAWAGVFFGWRTYCLTEADCSRSALNSEPCFQAGQRLALPSSEIS